MPCYRRTVQRNTLSEHADRVETACTSEKSRGAPRQEKRENGTRVHFSGPRDGIVRRFSCGDGTGLSAPRPRAAESGSAASTSRAMIRHCSTRRRWESTGWYPRPTRTGKSLTFRWSSRRRASPADARRRQRREQALSWHGIGDATARNRPDHNALHTWQTTRKTRQRHDACSRRTILLRGTSDRRRSDWL